MGQAKGQHFLRLHQKYICNIEAVKRILLCIQELNLAINYKPQRVS